MISDASLRKSEYFFCASSRRRIVRLARSKLGSRRVSIQSGNLYIADRTSASLSLRRSPDQIRYMMSQGTAPKHAKIGGRVVFKESDVEAYIEDAFREAS